MKTQVTSILLCALLCSTWGHEYLSAKRLAPEARSKNSPLARLQKRAAPPQQCQWVCERKNTTGGLHILVNETTGLIGIVNITAEVALVIDVNASLVALFNGTSGDVVIINIKTNVGVYITASETTSVWLKSKLSFDLYFKSLKSLQVLIDLKVGTTFKVDSVPNAILKIIGSLLVKLSARIELLIAGNLKVSVTILINIASSIIKSLTGQLNGLLALFGDGLIALYGDILWLVGVLEGLELFFSKISGGLLALLKLKVELDLAVLLGAANGLELLVNLLLSIVARVDLSKVLGGLLNSVEGLIAVIVKLGGDVSSGVTGVFKIINAIISLKAQSIKLEALIGILLEFSIQAKLSIDISVSINGLQEVIKIQESLYSSESITVLITFVQNLQQGKLIIGGINISEIINILIKGAVGGALTLVVTILLRLTAIVEAAVAIPSLLFYLLGQLTNSTGVRLCQQVIPNLSINVSVSTELDIVLQIFRGVNIETILKLILTGFDINVVLTSIPVLGEIYAAVSSAVSAASNNSLSLKTILKSSGASSVVVQIQAWIKAILQIFQKGGSVTVEATTQKISWGWPFGRK